MKTVAIIGAGPTGLALASFLTHYGVSVNIFDKNKNTTPYSKAMVVHARTLEALDDIGVADEFEKQGEHILKVKFLNIKNKKETVHVGNVGRGFSKFSHILGLEQSKTEKILADHLKGKGVKVHRSHDLTDITKKRNKYILTFDNGKSYEADYIVGCDGARSFMRHYLNFKFGGSTVDERFFIADTVIKSKIIKDKELYIKFGDKSFGLIFPIEAKNKHYRVIGVLPEEFRDKESVKFDDIKQTVCDQLDLPVTFTKTNRFSTYRVHSRYCHFGKGKIFLAGDAAHIHSPAGGRGMNTGIQDAYNLAWKLALVINGKAGERLLKTYDEERYPIAQELIKTTDRLFVLATTNSLFSFFFRTILIKVAVFILNITGLFRKNFFPFMSMISLSYKKSYALIQSNIGKITAGQRLPYNKEVYNKTLGKEFMILNCGIDLGNILYEILKIKDYLKLKQDYFIILRPDKHIAYIGNDIKMIKKYFAKLQKK